MAANELGFAPLSPIYADLVRPPNNARFLFLDPHAAEFFCDWDKVANDTVALLRAEAGRDRYDRQLSDLIGELSTRSEEFRVRWAAHHRGPRCLRVRVLYRAVLAVWRVTLLNYEVVERGMSLIVAARAPGFTTPPMMLRP